MNGHSQEAIDCLERHEEGSPEWDRWWREHESHEHCEYETGEDDDTSDIQT